VGATQRNTVFTRDILELENALEKGREEFREKFADNIGRLKNCSCGDSFLEQALIGVCHKAIEKYILK